MGWLPFRYAQRGCGWFLGWSTWAAVVVAGASAALAQVDPKQGTVDALVVVPLEQAGLRTADMGEVLSRTSSLYVRRQASLGSSAQLSISGVYDAEVLVEGIPLAQLYAQQLADLPVNLFQSLDVYRGVVPVRRASNVLGGVLDLQRPALAASTAQASYQLGSFGLH